MADTRFSITKLNNTNFQVWKCKVELLLIKEDLWHTISTDRPAIPDERWLKADRQARATVGLLVEDDQLRHIKDTSSAKEAWTALQNYHQKASLTNQVFLFKKICSMKLSENGDMEWLSISYKRNPQFSGSARCARCDIKRKNDYSFIIV